MEDVKRGVRTFVVENYLFGSDGEMNDDDSFLESGIIDSTGVLELVAFLEKHFDLKVENDELTTDNLDSINQVVAYIQRKLDSKRGDPEESQPELANTREDQ